MITVSDEGSVRDDNAADAENAEFPMLTIESGSVTDEKLVAEKARSPILRTESGIVMELARQFINASRGITVTVSGMTIDTLDSGKIQHTLRAVGDAVGANEGLKVGAKVGERVSCVGACAVQ